MNKCRGFSLMELIVFIVIISVSVAGLYIAFGQSLKTTSFPYHYNAMHIAQQRMELILAQRHTQGFAAMSDPCVGGVPPSECSAPSGFSVSAVITPNWGGDINYKEITVTVTGNGNATLKGLVASY